MKNRKEAIEHFRGSEVTRQEEWLNDRLKQARAIFKWHRDRIKHDEKIVADCLDNIQTLRRDMHEFGIKETE